LNKLLIAAASTAVLLGAASASAQGLPYSSNGDSSDLPWSVNRQPPRDLNAYLGGSTQSKANEADAQHNSVAKK
jgi:hypothetical protein